MTDINDETLVEEIQMLSNNSTVDQQKAVKQISEKIFKKGVYLDPLVISKLIPIIVKLMGSEELYLDAVCFVANIIYYSNDKTVKKQYSNLAIEIGVLQHINNHLSSTDPNVLIKSLCCLRNIAIQHPEEVFKHIPLPKIVKHHNSENEHVSFHAAYCVLSFAFGFKESGVDIIKTGAVEPLVNLLESKNDKTVEAALCALLQIPTIGGCFDTSVISEVIPTIVELMESDRLYLYAVCFVANIIYYSNDKTAKKQYSKLAIETGVLQHINNHLSSTDLNVLIKSLLCLRNLAFEHPEEVFKHIPLPKIVKHHNSKNEYVSFHAACCVYGIAFGFKESIPDIIKAGAVEPLVNLLESKKDKTIEVALCALLQISENGCYFDTSVISKAIPTIVKLMKSDRLYLHAVCFVASIIYYSNDKTAKKQYSKLAIVNGVLQHINNHLSSTDPNVLIKSLLCLCNLAFEHPEKVFIHIPLPKIVKHHNSENEYVSFHAACCVYGIAFGFKESGVDIIKAGAVEPLVNLLKSKNDKIVDVALCALLKISENGCYFDTSVISKAIPTIVKLMESDRLYLKAAIFVGRIIYYSINDQITTKQYAKLAVEAGILLHIKKHLSSTDSAVLVKSVWCLYHLSHRLPQEILKTVPISNIVKYLKSENEEIAYEAVAYVANISYEFKESIPDIIKAGAVVHLVNLLESKNDGTVDATLRALLKISENGVYFTPSVISEVIPKIVKLMESDRLYFKTVTFVGRIIHCSINDQITAKKYAELAVEAGVLQHIIKRLSSTDSVILSDSLCCLCTLADQLPQKVFESVPLTEIVKHLTSENKCVSFQTAAYIKHISFGRINDETVDETLRAFVKVSENCGYFDTSVISKVIPTIVRLMESDRLYLKAVASVIRIIYCSKNGKTNAKQYAKIAIEVGILQHITEHLSSTDSNVLIKSLCCLRYFAADLPQEVFERIPFPYISKHLMSENKELAYEAVAYIAYILHGFKESILDIIKAGCAVPLVNLLESNDDKNVERALYALNEIISYDASTCQQVLNHGNLKSVKKLFEHPLASIKLRAISFIAVFTYYGGEMVDMVLKEGFIPLILKEINNNSDEIKIVSVKVIHNSILKKPFFIPFLINDHNIFSLLIDNLGSNNIELLKNVLMSLVTILMEVEYQEFEFQKFKECDGLEKIKKFLEHEKEEIRKYSNEINAIVEKHIKCFPSKTNLKQMNTSVLPVVKLKPTEEDIKNAIHINGKNYGIIRKLGEGGYGKIFLANELPSGKEYAIKVVDKKKLRNPENASREIQNLQSLNHPNIIKLYDAFESWGSVNSIHICMEYAAGGDLHDYIQKYSISEKNAKELFRQIVTGVQCLHSKNIAHRDLKPQNILLHSYGTFKIADFGLSKVVGFNGQAITFCGTRGYLAPEVIPANSRTYNGFKADIYSLGFILHDIVTNGDKNEMPLGCKALFNKLTSKNPSSRPSAADVLKNPWLS